MYEVLLRKQAEKYIGKLTDATKKKLKKYFEALENNPYNVVRPLRGELQGLHKVRAGDLRMIVLINEKHKTIDVLEIGPRGDIYK